MCDIHSALVSLDRSSKATSSLSLGAPRTWVVRHATATWAHEAKPEGDWRFWLAKPVSVVRQSGETSMPADSAALLVQCQMALRLTQEELGELLDRNRRTIQRWQENGFAPTAKLAETLADALRPAHPDLAEQVLELRRTTAIAAGVAPPARPATAEVIDAILRAAADAGGTSPEAIRPSIAAALLKAEEAGVEVRAIVAALKSAT